MAVRSFEIRTSYSITNVEWRKLTRHTEANRIAILLFKLFITPNCVYSVEMYLFY